MVSALILSCVCPASAASYSFEVDGVEIDLPVSSLNATPDDPQPGDVIFVRRIPIVLGEPGEYRLVVE